MRQKLETGGWAASADQHVQEGEPRERRGDLVGAESGPGPGRSWLAAIQRVQVRAGRPGQPRNAGRHGAFPSVATLVRYTGLSERTVRTCLDRLAVEGTITPCDPGIIAARIKRADRRPQGWDLNLSPGPPRPGRRRLAALAHQFPGLGGRFAAAAQPALTARLTGCNHRPVATGRGRMFTDVH